MESYVEVALPLPVHKTFTYQVPDEFLSEAFPGKRVLVPFGRRFLTGIVLGLAKELSPRTRILPLRQVLDQEVSISGKLLKFLLWVSNYYLEPIGEVAKAALPSATHLRSREAYLLTEEGRIVLNTLPPGSPEREVLGCIGNTGKRGILLASLGRKFSFPLRPCLEKMGEKGWIEKKKEIGPPRVKEKTVRWVRFLKDHPEGPLTSLQQEVLNFIRQAGEVPLRDLKKRYPGASAVLPKLESYGLVTAFGKEAFRQPSWEELEGWVDGPPFLLTEDQKKAVSEISAALHSRKFQSFLLHGVTGSGKTEVYLRAIQEAHSQGRQALLLVPEIALTAQLVAYFRSRITQPMAVLHSGLSPGERYDEWRRVKKGLAGLVIGARSAIFAPLESLGVLIVDEEHDPCYKQEEKVRYHARDLALVRGKMEDAVVVLGSATPSLESYYNALEKKFRLLPLPSRIDQRPLPEIQVLDMREEKGEGKERSLFSRDLEEAIRQNTERGEQALLFLNRRGFSTFALCRDCGFTYKCPNCSVSLTYHLSDKTFRCHYCDHSLKAVDRCPECASPALMFFGIGTQRLEEEIRKKFPEIHVGRMDRDRKSVV